MVVQRHVPFTANPASRSECEGGESIVPYLIMVLGPGRRSLFSGSVLVPQRDCLNDRPACVRSACGRLWVLDPGFKQEMDLEWLTMQWVMLDWVQSNRRR